MSRSIEGRWEGAIGMEWVLVGIGVVWRVLYIVGIPFPFIALFCVRVWLFGRRECAMLVDFVVGRLETCWMQRNCYAD